MLIRSGAIDIIVIDSVAALVPRAEIEGEMGDSHVGLQARLMSQALRKITGALSNSGTTAIFINQLREKIGVMFGSPETTTGGKALKFYSSVRLDVRRIETLKDGARRGRQPHPGQGRQEQGGPAVQAGRVRHRLRPGHQPRGLAHRRRRRAGRSSRSPAPGTPTRATSSARARRTSATSCATTPTWPTRSRRRSRRSSASGPRSTTSAPIDVVPAAGRLLSGGVDAMATRPRSARRRPEDADERRIRRVTPESAARTICLRLLTGAPRTRAELATALAQARASRTTRPSGCSTGSPRSG